MAVLASHLTDYDAWRSDSHVPESAGAFSDSPFPASLGNFEIRVGDHDGVSSNVACAHGLSNTDGAIRDYGCHAHGRYVFIAFHTSDGFANVEEFEVMGVHGNHQLQASTPSFLQCTDLGLFCDSRAQTDLDTHAKMNSAMQSLGLSCDPNNDSGRGYAGAPTADSPSGTQ